MVNLQKQLELIEKINDRVMPKTAYFSADGRCVYANKPFLDWQGASDTASSEGGLSLLVTDNLPDPRIHSGAAEDTVEVECQLGPLRFRISYSLDYQGDDFLGYMVCVDALQAFGSSSPAARTGALEGAATENPSPNALPYSLQEVMPLEASGTFGFGDVLETVSESFCIIDSSWYIRYWNSAAERTTGQRKEAVLGRNMWEVFPQERNSALYDSCHAAMREGRHCTLEHHSVTGTWYYNSIHPIARGGIIIYFKDITDRRQAEEQLNEIKNNLDGLLNATDDLMWSVDSQYRLISANAAFMEYVKAKMGYPYASGDVVVVDKATQMRSQACEELYQRCLRGQSFSTQNPSMGDRLTRYNPIFRSDGSVSGVACHSTDLSEMRRLEREKTDSAERFRALIQNGSDLIFIFGKGYTLEYTSPSALAVLGESRLERKDLMELLHKEDYHVVLAAFKEGENRKTFTVKPFRIKNASGNWLWIEATVDNLLDNPAVLGTVVNARDVTAILERESEHKVLIKELVSSNSDLTQFSYITSHNLRAPLSNISGILAYIERAGLDPELQGALAMLDAASLDLKSTLDDLSTLLLVRDGAAGRREQVDIVQCFHHANQSYIDVENEIGARLYLNFEAAGANFSPQYLRSIFSSLLSNAIKYRKHGRKLEIRVSTRRLAGGAVEIRFEDNGLGIDVARHGKRVFGMYQRFHPNIEGKGLSLFMAQAQLQSLGGTISLESAPDAYTVFTICIPG